MEQKAIGRIKRKIVTITILFFISFQLLSIVTASFNMENGPHFNNVNVLIIGRCRTIYSDGTWPGGLYHGHLAYAEVGVGTTKLEKLYVVIYNESVLDPWITWSGLTFANVGFSNASGTFFWGAKGYGVRLIPPIIIVRCHAEEFGISTDH